MNDNLFIFDLDGTISKFSITQDQFLETKKRIKGYLKSHEVIVDNLRPILPKIIFLTKTSISDKEKQQRVIKECFSMIDEIELNPRKGIITNESNTRLLLQLKDAGASLGILSNNGKKGVLNALSRSNLNRDLFEFVITRDDVEMPKPFANPFLKITSYLSEKNCFLFTDGIYDLLPILNLGKVNHWSVSMYIVLQMDIRNMSYDWNSGDRFEFDPIVDNNKG